MADSLPGGCDQPRSTCSPSACCWAIFAVVFYASEANRPTILAGCAAAFLIAGLGGALYVWLQARSRQPVFSDTIKVLKGDEKRPAGSTAAGHR